VVIWGNTPESYGGYASPKSTFFSTNVGSVVQRVGQSYSLELLSLRFLWIFCRSKEKRDQPSDIAEQLECSKCLFLDRRVVLTCDAATSRIVNPFADHQQLPGLWCLGTLYFFSIVGAFRSILPHTIWNQRLSFQMIFDCTVWKRFVILREREYYLLCFISIWNKRLQPKC